MDRLLVLDANLLAKRNNYPFIEKSILLHRLKIGYVPSQVARARSMRLHKG